MCRDLKAQAQQTREGLQSAVGKTHHWRRSTEEQQALLKQSSGHALQLQVTHPSTHTSCIHEEEEEFDNLRHTNTQGTNLSDALPDMPVLLLVG